MRHNQYNKEFRFVHEPEEFTKYTDREFLRFCLAAMYMPGTRSSQARSSTKCPSHNGFALRCVS